MKIQRLLLTSVLAATLLATAAPLGASTLVEANPKVVVRQGEAFSVQVTLPEAALCKGTHQLSPHTPYRVDIVSLGDGSVRASFFLGGVKKGEANGIIIINSRPAGESKVVPGAANDVVTPGPPSRQATFSSLGFGANTPSSFVKGAGKMDLAIGGQGQNQILIGLLLPAVQPSAVQKAREAAVAPAK